MLMDTGEDVLASFESIIHDRIEARLKEVNTCLPGQITAFYAEDQTADVQPTLTRLFADNRRVPLPLCTRVPIVFPSGGGFSLTFPVQAGDECLLIFSQRAIDAWWQSGDIQDPVDFRAHHLSDGIAIVGLRNVRRALPDIDPSSCVLRSDDNRVSIALGPKNLTLKAPKIRVEGDIIVSGDVIADGVSLTQHMHGGVTSGGAQTSPPMR